MTSRTSQMESNVPVSSVNMPPCLYCGESTYDKLLSGIEDRLGVAPGLWGYEKCRNCGSALVSPFPAAEDLAAYYPATYTFAPELAEGQPFRRLIARLEHALFYGQQNRAQVSLVLRHIRNSSEQIKLLDIGCGRGLRLTEFARRGLEVRGVDFQAEAVEYVNHQLKIPAVQAPLEHLDEHFAPSTFDAVTAFYVLEHVTDVGAIARSVLRILKPGGWFIGAVPLIDSWQAGIFKEQWSQATEAPRHVSLPSIHGIESLCRKVGYEEVKLVPDSVWACVAVLGLSVFMRATTTHFYGKGGLKSILVRGMAAGAAALSFPFCFTENFVAHRPALGIVFARKPR